MITQVTYARVYNLGNYESLRLEAVALVQDGATGAAWEEARAAVEAEYAVASQRSAPAAGASYDEPPASDKQRNFIAKLQDDLGWTSHELALHAEQHSIDLVALTLPQASKLINQMKEMIAALKSQDLL